MPDSKSSAHKMHLSGAESGFYHINIGQIYKGIAFHHVGSLLPMSRDGENVRTHTEDNGANLTMGPGTLVCWTVSQRNQNVENTAINKESENGEWRTRLRVF